MLSETIFRAYDIRGVYGKDLTEEAARRIGRALAFYMNGEGKTLLVGKDVRLSSQPLATALAEGVLSGGLNVEDIGTVTTPLLYFASVHYGRNGGVMVTASHNPPEWNGFKIWAETSFIAMGMGMEVLKHLALEGQFEPASKGRLEKNPSAIADYENYVTEKIDLKRTMKAVVDPGNGSSSVLTPMVFWKAGIDLVAINAEPDGTFSTHPPEPNKKTLAEVARLIRKEKAAFGVGFDGDGDRAIFVDDKGRRVSSASILVLLAEDYLKRRKGAAVVYEVSCSMALEETIKAHGGKPVLSRVGHTYIVDKMLKEKAAFGGETSGHFYFEDVYGFDDAVFASLKVAEVLSRRRESLSEIVDSQPKYPRIPGKSYKCPDGKKFRVVEEISKKFGELGYETVTIDGVKVVEDEGWFLVRPSNTQPMIRLTVEARNEEALQRLAKLAEKAILEKRKS
ncbi:MAG: phosphomannomutase/phosphoglucomutase [Candidatus Bathyarchaeota archaeon]|nr:phosphomannomutase/phosphoglucomutase [Candidatus Bathyarchaeota archaeon]